MSNYTKYGFCRGGCQKWVPRDEMLSVNVAIYDSSNRESKIPLRFCPACHTQMCAELEKLRWDNLLKFEIEIKTNRSLAEQSDVDYDPCVDRREVQRLVMGGDYKPRRIVAREVEDEVVTSSIPPDDESEAAMRRRGKQVDISY